MPIYDLSHSEILKRIHEIKRTAMELGHSDSAICAMLDSLADDIAFGAPINTNHQLGIKLGGEI